MSTLSQFSGGGRIKSIQRGIIALSSNTGTYTLLTAVDTTKSILYHLGVTENGLVTYSSFGTTVPGIGIIQIGLELTNSTTITAKASVPILSFPLTTTVIDYGSVSFQLVEYY
jgi:hypothetical protein